MEKKISRWRMNGLLVMLLAVLVSSFTVTSAAEKVKVNFWTLNTRVDLSKKIIADFKNVNPNVEIVMTLNGTDDQKRNLKIAASSGTLPDIWLNWGGSLASFYQENGLTANLASYAKKNKWNDRYMQAALDMCKFNGQLSGMPTALSGVGIYYNKQIFNKYQIKTPKTFAEFETVLKTLKSNGIIPISTGGKNGWLVMRINEALLEHFAGSKLHDKLANLDASWNSPQVIAMYAKFKEWNDNGYFPKGFISTDPNEDKLLLYSGQAAMVVQTSTFDSVVNLDKMDSTKYGWFPFPTDNKPNRVSGFVEMFQFSKKSSSAVQRAALEFAEFFYSDVEIVKYLNEYRHPLAIPGAKSPTELPNIPQISDALSKNGSWLITDQALPQEIINHFFYSQDAVIIGNMTPKRAAEFMDAEIKKYKASKK